MHRPAPSLWGPLPPRGPRRPPRRGGVAGPGAGPHVLPVLTPGEPECGESAARGGRPRPCAMAAPVPVGHGAAGPVLGEGTAAARPRRGEARGPGAGDLGSSAEAGAGPRRWRESVFRPSGRRRSRRRSRLSAAARLGEGAGLSQDGGQGGEAAAAAGVSARLAAPSEVPR